MQEEASTSRRSMLAALGIGGLGLALASQVTGAKRPSASQELGDHPIVGSWLVMVAPPPTPDIMVPVTSVFFPDGTHISSFLAVEAGPMGPRHRGLAIGVWEVVDERTVHQTVIQTLTTPDGTFAGTVTISGFPQVSDDGLTFVDDNPDALTVVRDATHAIVREIPGGSPKPVLGYRITSDGAAFPEPATQATPAR